MNSLRKAFSVGATAALLASLFTVGAASSVLADTASSGGGTVLPGGVSPAGCFTATEGNTSQPYDGFKDGSFIVTATDVNGNPATVGFDTSSVPVVTTVSGVGTGTAAVNAADHTLTVTLSGTQTTKLDSFKVCGLVIFATAGAPSGVVYLTVTTDNVTNGADPGYGLQSSLVTATGSLASLVLVGQTGASVITNAGSAAFMQSGVACGSGTTGLVNIAATTTTPAESVSAEIGTNATAIVYINGGAGFGFAHQATAAVTQLTCAAQIAPFVTVGDAIQVSAGTPGQFNAGVARQDNGATVTAKLGSFNALLASGSTVSFTVATAGVTFSTTSNTMNTPSGWTASGGLITGGPSLSADMKTLVFTLGRASVIGDQILFHPEYDVAASVAAGTPITVNVSDNGGASVTGNPSTVGYVGNTVVSVPSIPNVIIGQDNQSSGVITLTESAAGSFTDSAPMQVCLDPIVGRASWSSGTNFWAVVTKGNLKLNIGGLPVSQGILTISGSGSYKCLNILDYTASTVASTIEIHTGTTTAPAAGGPLLNVHYDATVGPVVVDVYSGSATVASNVIIAMAVYGGTPSATALSQPIIVPGQTAQAAGSIQITEGAPGSFYPGSYIDLCVMDQAHNFNQQVFWSNPVGVNAPVVTTNNAASGLVAHYVGKVYLYNYNQNSYLPSSYCLQIEVDSYSLVTLGTITVSNLKMDVVSDPVTGPVYVRVVSDSLVNLGVRAAASQSYDGSTIDQTVSNATVNATPVVARGDALGASKNATFTTATKVAKVGGYVTWKWSGTAIAGKIVGIYVYTKAADGTWSAPVRLTSRVADGAGNVYFSWKSSKAAWISVVAGLNGSMSKGVQARWK